MVCEMLWQDVMWPTCRSVKHRHSDLILQCIMPAVLLIEDQRLLLCGQPGSDRLTQTLAFDQAEPFS